MNKVVPITKIIATMAFSIWAIILNTHLQLIGLLAIEIVILGIAGLLVKQIKPIMALVAFSILLGVVQYLGTGLVESAIVTGLRMLCMTFIFILLLATTKLQDLTAALVKQCHVPYEYAFMFTSALRFVPDFLAESNAVREAQTCRGMDLKGSLAKRLKSYTAVIQPLILKSLGKSETMALSLELRGFGGKRNMASGKVAMGKVDALLTFIMLLTTIVVLYIRIGK